MPFTHLAQTQTPTHSALATVPPGTTGFAGVAWRKLLVCLVLLCCIAGCARPEPTLVVVVGGLGLSQLGDLRHALERQCPEAKVVNAGGWDGYKEDIRAIATAKPHDHIILVGHSFGCEAIAKAAARMPRVDLTVFIDPAWDDIALPKTTQYYLWFQRSDFDLEREAKILGAANPTKVHGNHNAIPHAPELIAEVVSAVKGVESRQVVQSVGTPVEYSAKRVLAQAGE